MNTYFEVCYAAVWDSQSSQCWNATADYSHVKTCRPKFAYAPIIDDLIVEDDKSLTLAFNMMFDTTGADNCEELFATIEVFNELTDELMWSYTMDDAEVS